VRVVIGIAQKVRVIRRDDRNARLCGEIEDERVELRLDAAGIVRLDLEIVALREGARVPERDALGFLEASLEQMRRDLAGDAGRGDDQPTGVFRDE
jgi:hypothetical protein